MSVTRSVKSIHKLRVMPYGRAAGKLFVKPVNLLYEDYGKNMIK